MQTSLSAHAKAEQEGSKEAVVLGQLPAVVPWVGHRPQVLTPWWRHPQAASGTEVHRTKHCPPPAAAQRFVPHIGAVVLPVWKLSSSPLFHLSQCGKAQHSFQQLSASAFIPTTHLLPRSTCD